MISLVALCLMHRKALTIKTQMRDECFLSHKGCHMFLSWIFFNGLQIGGWLMLGIVLSGIMVLAVTHVLGIRNMRRPQQRQLSRILWVEAVTKSRLARFV
mgnify:FL=1